VQFVLQEENGIVLVEGICSMEKIVLADNLHDWGMWSVPLFQLNPEICLATEKQHGKYQ
jgi:hypothetical protein